MTDPLPDEKQRTPGEHAQSWIDRVVRGWLSGRDRAEIFTEAAGAGTNAGLAYWIVLVLAGAIAALGLALNSAAVVIGAMLIAPLLSPVVGLGLSLAIGDGRLAIETAVIVLVSTLAVIMTGALLALALPVPFQTITAEIAARTRPTTLDLVIAVCSGLAGAAVTVARRSRLSGAVPGVAVSVALVPPLAVTGYGIGTGWNWAIIRGSLLLYGANLAGIVMSAMVVFLLAGMHRTEVLDVDATWHRDTHTSALTGWVERIPGLRSLGVMRSVWTRIALVATFVAVVAIPLSASLREIARESRIHAAVDRATRIFTSPGKSFIVSRDVELDQDQTRVVLNVATTGWFSDSVRHEFERRVSADAGEPVSLVLEQLPASSGDLSQLASLIGVPHPPNASPASQVASASATTGSRVAALSAAIAGAVHAAILPDSVAVVAAALFVGDSATAPVLHVAYAAPDTLSRQAARIVERQLAGALGLADLRVESIRVAVEPRPLGTLTPAALDSIGRLVRRYPRLSVELRAGDRRSRARADSIAARLARAGVRASGITVVADSNGRSSLRVVAP